jgi:hypothetical protein
MNKYQSYIIGKSLEHIKCQSVPAGVDKNTQYVKYLKENDKLIITQDSDITIVDYVLSIGDIEVDAIEKIVVLKEDKWCEIFKNNTTYIEFSFVKKTSQIKFVFKNNIADDYVISVEFVEADKEAYYNKQEQERKEALIKNAQIKHSTGADLVNVYFQPCNEQCVKTEIELWIAKGKRENHHGMLAYVPRLIGGEPEQLIAKYIIEEGTYFKAINGLAKGVYGYKIKQYDKDNNIIMESEFNYFDIGFSSHPVGRVNR